MYMKRVNIRNASTHQVPVKEW